MNNAPYLWIVSHLSLIGWPVVLTVCWKLFRFIFKAGRVLTIVEQRVLDGERTLHTMATNHLPHIQVAVEDLKPLLTDIREELRMQRIKE